MLEGIREQPRGHGLAKRGDAIRIPPHGGRNCLYVFVEVELAVVPELHQVRLVHLPLGQSGLDG